MTKALLARLIDNLVSDPIWGVDAGEHQTVACRVRSAAEPEQSAQQIQGQWFDGAPVGKALREARDSDVMSRDIVDRRAEAWCSAGAYFGEVLVNEVLAPSVCGF